MSELECIIGTLTVALVTFATGISVGIFITTCIQQARDSHEPRQMDAGIKGTGEGAASGQNPASH